MTQTGEESTYPWKYIGREDDGTGLTHYRARYASPGSGRFASEDPIGLAGGDANLYAYTGGDPVNFVDPSGQALMLIPIAIVAVDAAFIAHSAGKVAGQAMYNPCGVEPGAAADLAAGVGGGMAVRGAIRMTPDQQALEDLVDEVTNGGRKPLPRQDAEDILDWAGEVGYPGRRAKPRDVGSPLNWPANPVPHVPVAGRGGHVPVEQGVRPR